MQTILYLIKEVLTKIKKASENAPKDDVLKTEENEKIKDIVERILVFNNIIQLGKGLKVLTSSQMLCRLPTS